MELGPPHAAAGLSGAAALALGFLAGPLPPSPANRVAAPLGSAGRTGSGDPLSHGPKWSLIRKRNPLPIKKPAQGPKPICPNHLNVECFPNSRGTISGSSLGEGRRIIFTSASGQQQLGLPLTTGHQGLSSATQGPRVAGILEETKRTQAHPRGAYSGLGQSALPGRHQAGVRVWGSTWPLPWWMSQGRCLRPERCSLFLASCEVTKTNHQARVLHMNGPCVVQDWGLPPRD